MQTSTGASIEPSPRNHRGPRVARALRSGQLPCRWNAIWKDGATGEFAGPVHVSMNDYLIHRVRDIPRVARVGLALRHHWPDTEGALGLWFAVLKGGRRQVSVSVWRTPDDL